LSAASPHHASGSPAFPRKALVALGLFVIACGLLLLILRPFVSPVLYGWTGEEDYLEQIKGSVALVMLCLENPAPETSDYVPIAQTGVSPFGVNTFLEQEVEPAKVDLALKMARDAGFHWIRQEFPWEDIEISGKGDFWDHKWDVSAWEKYDRIVDLASKYGLEIIARLDNPPAWSRAKGDTVGSLGPPDNYQDFGDFVYAVVSRYRGRVRYYQIWNEPNLSPEWGNRPVNAAEYVELLKIAYTRAKEADPDCVVLSAGLAQTLEQGPNNLDDLVYLQQMYDAGARDYFDVMGVMAYGLWTGPTDRRVSPDRTNFSRPVLVREIMVRNGDAGKPIWATEIGWNALPPDFPKFPNFGRVTLAQQARYTVEAYERAQREWPWMGVMNYWFLKRATDQEKDQTFYYFRMLEPDFTPLPVYDAMREYANRPPVMRIGCHQEDHWALQWHGAWRHQRDDKAVLGRYVVGASGDGLDVTFEGTDIELVTARGPGMGRLLYSVDDGPSQALDLSAELYERHTVANLAGRLKDGEHHLAISVEKGPVMVDAFVVRRRRSSIALYLHQVVLGGVLFCLWLLGSAIYWKQRRRSRAG